MTRTPCAQELKLKLTNGTSRNKQPKIKQKHICIEKQEINPMIT